jgi:hypothetical protein
MVQYFNQKTGMNLTPIFNQYLRHTEIPTLELRFEEGKVSYRWQADEPNFTMPIRVGKKDYWQLIRPTTRWQTTQASVPENEFDVATDSYYVNVRKARGQPELP